MACCHTFTGVYDEAWFYLVPLAVELVGAPILSAIVDAQSSILKNESIKVLDDLKMISKSILEMIVVLKRMYEKCNPAVFYQRIRPYSGGSKNSTSFPNGVFYEGVEQVLDLIRLIPTLFRISPTQTECAELGECIQELVPDNPH